MNSCCLFNIDIALLEMAQKEFSRENQRIKELSLSQFDTQRKKKLHKGWKTGAFFFLFVNFFQHLKKLLNFCKLVNIKVSDFKLDHLGFYCK